MPVMRLDKLLSGQGFGTRKAVRELLRTGTVAVGKITAKNPDMKIDTEKDHIFLNGREIIYSEHVYIMMNKPAGVVSASRDPKQPTLIGLLPERLRRPGLFPAGRLDKDTEGLLIITDDGAFAHRMLSPKNHVPKRYLALLDGPVDEADKLAFEAGLVLPDGTECLPAVLEACEGGALVTICEGMFHQVKRMFEARGKKVVQLTRLSIGGLVLGGSLAPGQCREFPPDDVFSPV